MIYYILRIHNEQLELYKSQLIDWMYKGQWKPRADFIIANATEDKLRTEIQQQVMSNKNIMVLAEINVADLHFFFWILSN